MEKSELTKELIIAETIKLIRENNGNTEHITIRAIAKQANVGVGLINHYFTSKENLIEICVQKIINNVIVSFNPQNCKSNNPIDITKSIAKQVMDFLMENKEISKVSILGDLRNPRTNDNTMKTVMGFNNSLSGGNFSEQSKINSFLITMIMQGIFLRKDTLMDNFNIDFYNKSERDRFLDIIIDKITEGIGK